MLDLRNPYIKRYIQMMIIDVTLSMFFNIFRIFNLIPHTMKSYFVCLTFGALVFYSLNMLIMRDMRRGLIRGVPNLARFDGDELPDGMEAKYMFRIRLNTKRYYITNVIMISSFVASAYFVRIVLGLFPFKWLFAITNFLNFTGIYNNVYLSVFLFYIIFLATIYFAQIGVVKELYQKIEFERSEHELRTREARNATRVIRRTQSEADGKGLDILGMARDINLDPDEKF